MFLGICNKILYKESACSETSKNDLNFIVSLKANKRKFFLFVIKNIVLIKLKTRNKT